MSNQSETDDVPAAPAVPETVAHTSAEPLPASAQAETYGARSARGGIIGTLVQFAGSAVSFGTNIALAWLLQPDDFGLLALVTSFAGVLGVLRDTGAPQILVQRHKEFDR